MTKPARVSTVPVRRPTFRTANLIDGRGEIDGNALRLLLQQFTGQRGNAIDRMVTVRDLADLGLIELKGNNLAPGSNASLEFLYELASDGLLTVLEKPTLLREYYLINSERARMNLSADYYGIVTEKNAYNTAFDDLNTYLDTLTEPEPWDSILGNTKVDGETLRTKFYAVHDARAVLQEKIAEVAGTRADWSGVNDDNGARPEDYATRNKVFRQPTEPGLGAELVRVGDFWFDTDDDNHQYWYDGFNWVDLQDGKVLQALQDAAFAQSTADGKIQTFYQTTPPLNQDEANGDIWFDTDDGNTIYTYFNGAWTLAQDTDIPAAIAAAQNAQTTADGKAVVYYQNDPPLGLGAGDMGDMWIDTNDNNTLYVWDSSAWVLGQDWYSASLTADWGGVTGAGRPEDNATVGATDSERRQLNRTGTLFRETFDTADSINDWYKYSGGGAINWSNMAGTTALRNGLGSMRLGTLSGGNDMVWAVHNQRIPFNPNLLYKITFVVFESSGSLGTMYAGVTGFDVNDNPIAINGQVSYSSSHYVAAVNEPVPENTLKTYVGWFKGHATSGNGGHHPNPQDPATLHEDIRTFSPVIITQYQNVSGRTYVDAVIVEAFDNTTMRNVHTTIVGQNALADGLGIDQGDGNIRRAPFGLGGISARDGSVITFGQAFNQIPRVRMRGGLTYSTTMSGKHANETKAINLSSSGFTVSAKVRELAGSVVTRVDTARVAGGAGYDYAMHKSQAAQAWDDNYIFQFDVTVNNTQEGGEYLGGTATVYFYTNNGSGWVQRGSKQFNSPFGQASTTWNNQTHTVNVDGLTNHGGYEFAIDVVPSLGTPSATCFLDSITYETATAPAEETATPTGVSDLDIEFLAGE